MNNRLNNWLKISSIIFLIVAFVLFFLLFFGYGKIAINVPTGVKVQINGHPISSTNLKLRIGSYTVLATSPKYKYSYSKISIPLFATANYKPTFTPIDPSSILNSSILVDGNYGKPNFSTYSWFDNNSWVAGQLNLSGNFIALQYSNEQWFVKYYQNASGYPNSTANLPVDVVSYINSQEATYAAQQH